MSDFYIVSIKHTNKDHRYITFWRPDNCGYAWPLSWAGKYDRDAICAHQDYYNRGDDSIAIDAATVDALAVDPQKGTIDNDAGPVVLNTRDNWKKLIDAISIAPMYPAQPPVGKRTAKNLA